LAPAGSWRHRGGPIAHKLEFEVLGIKLVEKADPHRGSAPWHSEPIRPVSLVGRNLNAHHRGGPRGPHPGKLQRKGRGLERAISCTVFLIAAFRSLRVTGWMMTGVQTNHHLRPVLGIAVISSDHKNFRSVRANVNRDGMYCLPNIPAGPYCLEG